MPKLTSYPTQGRFLLNGVQVGTWIETAPGVVRATCVVGDLKRQFTTFEAASAVVEETVTEWLAALQQKGEAE